MYTKGEDRRKGEIEMSGLSILGVYSGIGMDTVNQFVKADKSRGIRFTKRRDTIQMKQNSWKDVGTRLENFSKKIETLQKEDTFNSKKVKSNIEDSPYVKVSASNDAKEGTYRVKVTQLAKSTQLNGGRLDSMGSNSEDLGVSGVFTYTNHEGKETTINVAEGDSLNNIVDNINSRTNSSGTGEAKLEGSGIRATIIDKRLVLTDMESGSRDITIQDSGLANNLGFSLGENNLSAEMSGGKGVEAKLEFNGLSITRSSNTIDDLVEGLTLDLVNVHEEEEVITVSQDVQKTVDGVKELVEQYNSLMEFIDKETDYGDPSAENNKTGALAGESTIIRLQSRLQSMFTNNKDTSNSGISSISELGVEVDRYGRASLDEKVLEGKIERDPESVGKFFYQAGDIVSGKEATGLTSTLSSYVDSYISGANGTIKNRQESYERELISINRQIDTFNMRIESKRLRYIQEFTALDRAMMQAESQMEYMFSQLGMGE